MTRPERRPILVVIQPSLGGAEHVAGFCWLFGQTWQMGRRETKHQLVVGTCSTPFGNTTNLMVSPSIVLICGAPSTYSRRMESKPVDQ